MRERAAHASSSSTGLTPAQIARIDGIFAPFDGTSRPGCAVGVARGGEPLYRRGFGMSDLQHGVPITSDSIFHVASVSKQFTAFAVAQLALQERLSLDDDVRTHVPEFPDYGHRITLRHLIQHTSGIRDQWELLIMAGWRYPADLFTQDDVLDIVVRQKALNFRPGDEYLYSNAGYTLLAIIVERVAKQSLRSFCDEHFFAPLGMTRTHVHDNHAEIVAGRTSAYQAHAGGWKLSVPNFDTHGATSVFTTVGDLLRWGQHLHTAVVRAPGILGQATVPAALNSGAPLQYGFGLMLESHRGVAAFGHGGADAGYRADFLCLPVQGLVIAVACNFAEAVPSAYARAVADVVLDPHPGKRSTPRGRPKVNVGEARLAQLAGYYQEPNSGAVHALALVDGALTLVGSGLVLTPSDPLHFSVSGVLVEFLGAPDEIPTGMHIGAPSTPTLRRLPEFSLRTAHLAGCAGDYWSEELRVTYRVMVEGTALSVHPFKQRLTKMHPIAKDLFGSGRFGTLRFERSKGKVTGFRLTGTRVRNVAFVRRPS